jgi:hypothetical protein
MPIGTKFKNFRDGGNQIAKFSVKIRILCTTSSYRFKPTASTREARLFYGLAENPTGSTALIQILPQQPRDRAAIPYVLKPTGKKKHDSSFQVVATLARAKPGAFS